MSIPLPQDGVSIINVEINADNHLICTLSDNSTIDAGELPGGTGGGLVQVPQFSSLTSPGQDDTLYLTKDDGALYYWNSSSNKYQKIVGEAVVADLKPVDLKTYAPAFDGVETTFNLPIDDKEFNVFIDGLFMTEGEDYSIDRTVSPNQITFFELWDESDICTIVWVDGQVASGGGGSGEDINLSLATTADIDKLFSNNTISLATEADIDTMFS